MNIFSRSRRSGEVKQCGREELLPRFKSSYVTLICLVFFVCFVLLRSEIFKLAIVSLVCGFIVFSSKIHPKALRASVDLVAPIEEKLGWDHLPREIQLQILGHLPYEQVFQLKAVSKKLKDLVESEVIPSKAKPRLTACYFFIEDEIIWKCGGFDSNSKKWRQLPPLTFLPADYKPDLDLLKEFLVCSKNGLVCINFTKSADQERLIVLNPLSGKWRELPKLNHPRNPVLMHMLVDPVTNAYQVIVAGSCRSHDEDLSKITELYDSRTGKWKRTGDLPGPEVLFAVNEHQSGVYQNGKLFLIGCVEENGQISRGIIAYDVEEGKWSSKWMHLLTFCTSPTVLQLLESNGEVFLFSERIKDGRYTEHRVDRLEWTPGCRDEKNTCKLINVIKNEVKIDGWSLEIYGPEYTCVPYSDSRFYIFKAYDHTGVVYDIRPDQGYSEVPQLLPRQYTANRERMFNTLYPILFTVEPSFSPEV